MLNGAFSKLIRVLNKLLYYKLALNVEQSIRFNLIYNTNIRYLLQGKYIFYSMLINFTFSLTILITYFIDNYLLINYCNISKKINKNRKRKR